jgi:hypothetical protein
MLVPTETKPPSLVRRSLICSQRPSSSCASKVRAPGTARPSLDNCMRTIGLLPAAEISS